MNTPTSCGIRQVAARRFSSSRAFSAVALVGKRPPERLRVVEEHKRTAFLHLELYVVQSQNHVYIAPVQAHAQSVLVHTGIAVPDSQKLCGLYAPSHRRRLHQQELQQLLAVSFVYQVDAVHVKGPSAKRRKGRPCNYRRLSGIRTRRSARCRRRSSTSGRSPCPTRRCRHAPRRACWSRTSSRCRQRSPQAIFRPRCST